ncbi:S8 family peptidase [Actinokineospora xionganensis]|nr:S8 family serine peptidase [Actinokineospora xionganensis]
MRMSRTRVAVAVTAAAATVGATFALAVPATAAEAQILNENSANAIKDSYIVMLKDGQSRAVATSADSLGRKYGGKVGFTYESALRGFSVTMSAAQARKLAADPAVASIEQDRTIKLLTDQPNPPSWGLDRVDQRDLPLNSNYSYATGASNVTAYVIDTGINYNHADFGGRASLGTDVFTDGQAGKDCQGHGTHVAGTVGGKTFGVAKEVKLKAVRVLNCQGGGSVSGMAKGVDWVTANAVLPAVANMSLYTGTKNEPSTVLDTAVKNSIAKGVTYAVAAGNFGDDSCQYSPQRVSETINVMASNKTDGRVSNSLWSSSYGTCSDLFAPGDSIVSASHSSTTGSSTKSGTSMAAPHVAGAAALYLAANPTATPKQVHDALIANATSGKVTNAGTGSPNKLLFVGGGGDVPPPTGCATKTNGTDVAIPDAGAAVTSDITISGCEGNASATAKVDVNIKHTWRGDLVIDLVAPDGSAYRLKSSSSNDSADNVIASYTVNLSSEARNGTWKLRVQDVARYDTGTIDTWSLTL